MITDLSSEFRQYLTERSKFLMCVVELYPRQVEDIASLSAPAGAIARYANACFVWTNNTGSYTYEPKLISTPSADKYLNDKVNEAEVTISNTERGKNSSARFVLNNKVKGCWMVIRLIAPEIPNESLVMWWGKCERPGKIDNTSLLLRASQEVGNFKIEIPKNNLGITCPNIFGREDCLGNETLEQKSPQYQQAFAEYGTMGCPDRKYETCIKLANTKFFRGQRQVAVSGQFSYVDPTVKLSRKDILRGNIGKALKTESWSALNQDENVTDILPIAIGRVQLAGHPFTWSDEGDQVKSLQSFCEGKISSFDFIKSRNEGKEIIRTIQHLGDWGGTGTQTPDSLFNGTSGYNSRMAYLEIVSSSTTVDSEGNPTDKDDAPLVTSIIRGLEIPVPDLNGDYTIIDWSNNPIHIIRYILTDAKFGKVPSYRIADDVNLKEAAHCDELVEDRSQSESIVLPSNAYDLYNEGFRRYRSTGHYTAYKDAWLNGEIDGDFPEFEQPEVRWYEPGTSVPLLPPQNVLRQRYTLNGIIQEKASIVDIISNRLLPCFRGFITYNHRGKIEIRTKRPADNAYIATNLDEGSINLPVTNISKWRADLTGYLLVGVATPNAEIRKAVGVRYSIACNNTPIQVVSSLDITTSNIQGGNYSSPGLGYININEAPSVNQTVSVLIGNSEEQTYITYTADGIESQNGLARMLSAYLNANYNFKRFYSAYILEGQPDRVWIRCEVGDIILDKPLEFSHREVEEILRVQMVFENCNDLTANQSAQFDNIVANSFNWNDDNEDDINAVTAKYVSAVDDFHLAELRPRTAWDVVDQEGEFNKTELDLRFVDNYWQAAYITKANAIEKIDGNVSFQWQSGLAACLLELGDVVAVRHDSGDGVLNYIPVLIKGANLNLTDFKVTITGSLYLSAAFDERVQPIDALLTTIMNKDGVTSVPPPTIGSNGSYTTSPEPTYPEPGDDYYKEFRGRAYYSQNGEDRI